MKDSTDYAVSSELVHALNKNTGAVMNVTKGYPVYQYSYFVNGSRDEQLVIREDNFEAFKEAKRNIDQIIEKRKTEAATKEIPLTPTETTPMLCNTCGQPAVIKSGMSKKGKAWKGIFCSADKEHVQWL